MIGIKPVGANPTCADPFLYRTRISNPVQLTGLRPRFVSQDSGTEWAGCRTKEESRFGGK